MQMICNYSEVRERKPPTLREVARGLALAALGCKERILYGGRSLARPRVQFLYIHHIFDDEVEHFDKLLAELAKTHVFISHAEAVRRVICGCNDEPCIAFSSDDGLKNNLQAANILNRYGAKACFYINPHSIGMKEPASVARFCRDRLEMPPIEFMQWSDVEHLLSQGHEIGSHTMSHTNVAEMPLSAFMEDLCTSRDILLYRCGKATHFAYPYGQFHHFNKDAMHLVFQAGYGSCASAERGCHFCEVPVAEDKLLIRRDHVVAAWPLAHTMYFIRRNSRCMDSGEDHSGGDLFPNYLKSHRM
ncbi:MAG: polysaccharide deacetylase family protein [Akkermansiaceae bacterium]|nr:polysaccharide deacetylase family protein [Akkermansiaceae bacterium]